VRGTRLVIFGYVLAVIAVGIAGTIEWLNFQAGGRLPSREYRDGDPAEGCVTWRTSLATSEAMWRRFRGPRDEQGNPATRLLTAEEDRRMRSEIAWGIANNRLLYFVSTAGLAQYLLIPLLLVAAVALMLRGRRSHAVFLYAVVAVTGFLLWYRAYFPSLGA
jgi:hypothetical protein